MIIHTPRFVYRAVLTLVSIMVFAWMPVMGQLQIVDESGSIFCHVGSTAITVAASGVTELCSDNSSSATPADIYNFTGSEVFSGASTESISAPGAENLPLSGLSEVQTQLSLNKAGLPTNSFLQGINRINFGLILLAFLALSLFYLFLRSTIWKPRFLIATLMALMFAINSNAQNSVSYTTSDTWTCPAGVTSITVECWGGGGRGGAMDATGTHGVGGGGGGAYAKGQVTVVPGNSYTVNVGNGSTTDVAGGDSWFQNSSTVMAKGGNSVPTNQTTGASGGLATASVGTTAKWSGGAGADGTNSGTYYSGGGGGGAGSTGVGGDASGSTGGTGTTIGGGNGANGISSNGNGVAGNTYSGGGSGGRKGTGTVTRVGGAGANGQVIVTWTLAGYCSGNALSVYSQTNVNNDNRATGVPNNSGAELYETNDQLALELTDGSNLLTAGGSVDVIWERTSNNNTSILVEISTDGTNWTFVNDYTDINPQNNWLTQSIPLSINTRYIRFTSNNGWDLAIDAVTFNTPCAPPGPSLNVTPASLDFGSVVSGSTSTNQTYVLSGTNLTGYPGNITVTAPTNFEVSLTSGSGFGSSVSVPYSSATLVNRTIYVRFKPTAVNTTYTGNISNAGGGATTQNVAVTGNSNLNYCGFTFGNVRPITKVVFSTLTNSSSELTSSAATEDFTSLTSNVTAGQNYTLTVQGYTNGNNTYNYIAFFDWNQDGDFVDTGESFNIGTITNSTGLDGKSASTTITVPSGATLGNTRFRIISHYNSYNTTPCSVVDGNSYGQIEDYTLNIIPNISISTSAISPTSYCAGASVSVPYTKSGTFNSGNIFTAQLSNASGSFASPVNIGTLTSTSAGTISGTIPAGTIYGIGYRIRVVSSTPATIGTDNGSNLTVNPIPIATANPASQTICSGTAPSIALSSNVSGTTFAWTVVESGVSGASASSGATIAQTLTATGTTAGTATYTITPTANGCAGTPEPVVITVNPMPVATATPTTQTICSGTAPSIVLTSNVSGTTFAWTVVQSGVSGATASSGSTIAQTLTATGTTAGTATYTITPTANGCAGTPLTVVITVNPIPDVTATLGSQTICSGTATSIALTSNVSGANFVWMVTQSGVSGASIGSGSNITQTLTATGSIAGTATYTIAPLANGCSGSSIPVIITVDPNPVATATPASKTICSGTAPSIALSSNVSGTTFAWTVVESGVSGATASSGSTIAQTLTATGTTAGTATYTITPTANGCAGSPITVVVTVNPIPIVTATPASQTICSVTAPSIALTSNVSGTTFAWTVVQSGVSGATTSSGSTIAQTLTATGTTAGTATYSITPTASGCAGTPETVVITVDPIPVTNTTPGSQTICSGTAPSIALTSNVSGTTFAWTVVQSGVSGATFASGSAIAQNLAATGTTAGTATYTITPTANGCMGATKIAVITVNPIPVATTTPASQTISSGTAPSIALTSNVSGTTFSWTVAESDVSGATSATGSIISQTLTATVTTTGTATYTITPTANGCSGATKIVVITVNPTPIATATPASETICSGTAPSIALTSNLTGTTYTWTVVQAGVSGATASSGETIAQTLTTTGISAGTATYTITPFANGFAGTPIIVVITVNPIPVATATPAAQSICSGTAPSIALTSNVSGTTFAWTVIESDVSGA
ncbi:MAG: PKD-like domain-containing protein, partial [Lentimicrobiaceae bacterium]